MADRYSYRRESEISHFTSNLNHPSFSSTLLDAIYRSIDEGEDEMEIYREGVRKKQSCFTDGANVRRGGLRSDDEMANFRRACMIEKWMEKKVTENVVVQRKSVADLHVKKPRKDRENSSSSSSDSSCGVGGGRGGYFYSSETEPFPAQRPTQNRTGFEKPKHVNFEFNRREPEQKPTKSEGGFSKTKLRALKIYGDLKKVKQPISPGGKLAGFLKLFSGEKLKKHKIAANDSDDSPSLKSTNASTCSSTSSFSRPCLSKTPSSGGKPSTAAKRSVRFSPVGVIVDEDRHKSLHSEIKNNNYQKNQTSNFEAAKKSNNVNIIRNVINEELMAHVREKNRRVEEVARDLLRNYQRKNQASDLDFGKEEEDDAASYASSDLFELDNLSAIGMERYREELPVYESTHLDSTVAEGRLL